MARKDLDGQDGKSESGEVGNEKEGRDDQPKSNETDDWTKTVEAANLVGEAPSAQFRKEWVSKDSQEEVQ